MGKTLFEKIWTKHVVRELDDGSSLLYIDRHLVHEVTSPQAFEGVRLAGRKVRAPELAFATMDHNVPTTEDRLEIKDPVSRDQVIALRKNCEEADIELFGLGNEHQRLGLAVEEAEQARRRLCSEPFTWLDDETRLGVLREAAAEEGLRITRGGRYWHLMGDTSKAEAMRALANLYLGRLDEAAEQVDDRRLARPGGADQGVLTAGRNHEGSVFDHRPARFVAETHPLELDLAAQADEGREGEQDKREFLGGSESECEICQRRREEPGDQRGAGQGGLVGVRRDHQKCVAPEVERAPSGAAGRRRWDGQSTSCGVHRQPW